MALRVARRFRASTFQKLTRHHYQHQHLQFHRAAFLSTVRASATVFDPHHSNMSSSSIDEKLRIEFNRKLELGKTLPPLEDNHDKLEMYALFKQIHHGPNTTTKPGMFDFVAKAKWEAWTKLGDMNSSDAMHKYIAIIDNLATKHGVDPNASEGAQRAQAQTKAQGAAPAKDDVLVMLNEETGLLTIQLNRPTRHNALNRGMYREIQQALTTSATQSNVKAVLLKAVGPSFSSGNDLSMFATTGNQTMEALAEEGALLLEEFVDAFITYPKPIVAAVQGPAVGIAVTILALCDLIYISDAATFQTPFTALGQSPEACSSLLFPRTMGFARANALLLLGDKMHAQDAVTSGFATASFGIEEFEAQVQRKVDLLLSRYPQSMQLSKALIRNTEGGIPALQAANKRECEVLKKMWLSSECMDAILQFQTRKSAL